MIQGTAPKTIRCPCGNLMMYHDREDDVAKFGLTVDEIASATGAMPIVDREKGTVSWLCRDCVNRARRKPRWYSVKERLPTLKDGQNDRQVLVWLKRPSKDIMTEVLYYRAKGFAPVEEFGNGTVSHWAEMPGPYDPPDDELYGVSPEDHSKALFAASRVMLSPHEWTWKQDEQEAMARLCHWAACLLPLPRRPLRCSLCKGTRIRTTEDVGYDIDTSGEETQHEDRCLDCGATRLWGRRAHNFTTPTVWWGEWEGKGDGHADE